MFGYISQLSSVFDQFRQKNLSFIRPFSLALSFVFLNLFSFYPVHAEVVEEIVVKGTARIEPETIMSYLDIDVDQEFDQADLDRSLRRLFATGLFADVSIEVEQKVLNVVVTENPIINRIAFEGNKRVESKSLEKEILLKPRIVYTRQKVQSDVQRILDIYRRTGRFSAVVEPKIIKLEQNRVDLVFEIDEGPKTKIQKIQFIGNRKYSDSHLEGIISTKESRWYRFFTSDDTYDPDRVNYDKELLRRYYLNQGYVDFRVNSVVAELSPNKKDFYITFTVEEGSRYKIGKVEFSTELKNLDISDFENVVKTETGDWYSLDGVEKSVKLISTEAENQQYAFVDINPKITRNKADQTVDIMYEIAEGPKVYVERINITGNVRTQDRIIRRQFTLAEGDPFSQTALKESERKIRELGFFEKVEVKTNEGSEEDQAIIDVNIGEKSTGDVMIGGAFSTSDGPTFDFGIRERNLLGKAQDLAFTGRIGKKKQSYDLSFVEPYFMDADLSAGISIFHRNSNNLRQSSFDEKNTGSAVQFSFPLSENLSETLGYKFTLDEITHVKKEAPQSIKSEAGRRTVSSLFQILYYNKLDSSEDPTDGYYISLSNTLAGLGGSTHLFSSTLSGGYYISPADQLVLSFVGLAGYTVGLGERVRIADRFFLGGDNFRGFRSGGVGPRETITGSALGGNRMAKGTFELTSPIGFPEEIGVRGHLFTDIGTLGRIDTKAGFREKIKDNDALRMSAGAGISFKTPMGTIRADYARALIKEDYDHVKAINIRLGTSF